MHNSSVGLICSNSYCLSVLFQCNFRQTGQLIDVLICIICIHILCYLGDSCCNPLSMGRIKSIIQQRVGGVYVKALEIGSNVIEVKLMEVSCACSFAVMTLLLCMLYIYRYLEYQRRQNSGHLCYTRSVEFIQNQQNEHLPKQKKKKTCSHKSNTEGNNTAML